MFKKFRCKIPMNLQLFAEGGEGAGDGASESGAAGTGSELKQGSQQAPAIDYNKIQQMLDGTLAAKEDTALKAYFKQQGLSQQEAETAMADFKAQKAAKTPDVAALQAQVTQGQAALVQAQVTNAATLAAIGLGIDAKTIPYVLKLADMSQVVGQDGKINDDNLKAALNKVLEDVPGLKATTQQATGFQIGAQGGGKPQSSVDDQLDRIFGVKK